MSLTDPYLLVRTLVDSAFSHLTWHEDACRQVGLRGISQVWKETPAWYFWLEEFRGAFLLRLHDGEPFHGHQLVNLSLHYFPAPDEEAVDVLSVGEQGLLADERVFDRSTSTPHYEAYEQCMGLFMVGEIGCILDQHNRLQLLFFSTALAKPHQAHRFFDVLVQVLNFQAGQPPLNAYAMHEDEATTTLLLVYSEPVSERFFDEFQLDKQRLVDISGGTGFKLWKDAACMDAVCSMSGACSCHH